MQKPIFIYNFKPTYVEVQLVGIKIPQLNILGTSVKTISYPDFLQLMKSSLDSNASVRTQVTNEIEAIHKAMTNLNFNDTAHTSRGIVTFPELSVGFKTEGNSVLYVTQYLNGSSTFPNFVAVGNGRKIKFDTKRYIVETKLNYNANGYLIEEIKVKQLIDLIYVREQEQNTVELPFLSKYATERKSTERISKVSDLKTLDYLRTFNLALIEDNNLKEEITKILNKTESNIEWRDFQ